MEDVKEMEENIRGKNIEENMKYILPALTDLYIQNNCTEWYQAMSRQDFLDKCRDLLSYDHEIPDSDKFGFIFSCLSFLYHNFLLVKS